MFKKLATGCVVGSFTLLSLTAANAQTTGSSAQSGQSGAMSQSGDRTRGDGTDQDFLKKAAIANLAEIQLGKLAQQKAENAEVKQFAQMMVEGHTKALNELKQLASPSGENLPSELDEKHRDLHERLSGLSGAEFDREYMDVMVQAHEDTEDMLEDRVGEEGRPGRSGAAGTSGATGTTGTTTGTTASENRPRAGSNPAIDSWAQKTLQNVRTHLQKAKDLKDRLDK